MFECKINKIKNECLNLSKEKLKSIGGKWGQKSKAKVCLH